MGETRNARNILVGKHEGKHFFLKPRHSGNTAINSRVLDKAGNLLTRWPTVSFSTRSVVHG